MIKLYKTPSLTTANTKEEIVAILTRKAEHFENSEAKIKDYIGNALNILVSKINEALVRKIKAERELKELERLEYDIKHNLALAMEEVFGINEFNDKTSSVCSTIKIVNEVEEATELKEIKLTESEMRNLLKINGIKDTKLETVIIPKKEKTVKLSYKRGKVITKMQPKDAKEFIDNLSVRSIEEQ